MVELNYTPLAVQLIDWIFTLSPIYCRSGLLYRAFCGEIQNKKNLAVETDICAREHAISINTIES